MYPLITFNMYLFIGKAGKSFHVDLFLLIGLAKYICSSLRKLRQNMGSSWPVFSYTYTGKYELEKTHIMAYFVVAVKV